MKEQSLFFVSKLFVTTKFLPAFPAHLRNATNLRRTMISTRAIHLMLGFYEKKLSKPL